MDTTTERVGPWLVTYTWDPAVSRTGPVRVTIEPGSADPRDLGGGITTTVLRELHPVPPETPRPDLTSRVDRLREVAEQGLTDEYLIRLADLYTLVAPYSHNPGGEIAEMLGKAPSTVKNALVKARKAGYLTTVPHRRGGELTPTAEERLRQYG